jgi:hypothetical protein
MTIFVFIVFNIRCSTDKDLDAPPNDNVGRMVLIKVKEYKTGLPLSGVEFSTYSCNKFDIEFGCTNRVVFGSCITDNNGICNCRFPSDLKRITIEKSMYWYWVREQIHFGGNSYEFIIEPEAWVNINFITNVEYPTTSYFYITVKGEGGFYSSDSSFIQAANNSNTILTLFGNEENVVDWVLYITQNTSSEILNAGSFTLNPNKFENLTYTLNY